MQQSYYNAYMNAHNSANGKPSSPSPASPQNAYVPNGNSGPGYPPNAGPPRGYTPTMKDSRNSPRSPAAVPAYRQSPTATYRTPGTGYNTPNSGYRSSPSAAAGAPGASDGYFPPNATYSSNSRPASPVTTPYGSKAGTGGYGGLGPAPTPSQPSTPASVQAYSNPPSAGYNTAPVRYNPPSFGPDEPSYEANPPPAYGNENSNGYGEPKSGYQTASNGARRQPPAMINTNMNNMNMAVTSPEKAYTPQRPPPASRSRSDSTTSYSEKQPLPSYARPPPANRSRSDSQTSYSEKPAAYPNAPRSRSQSQSRNRSQSQSRSRSGSTTSYKSPNGEKPPYSYGQSRSRSASASSGNGQGQPQNFSRPTSMIRSPTAATNPKKSSPLAQAHDEKDMARITPKGDQSLVRDPAFWKRFSTAVHLSEALPGGATGNSPTSSKGSVDLKHTDSWLKQQDREKRRVRRNCWVILLIALILIAAVVFVVYYFLKMRKN